MSASNVAIKSRIYNLEYDRYFTITLYKKNHIQRAARNFCSTNLTSNYSKYFGPDSFRLLRRKFVSSHQMLFAFFISSYGAFLMESDVGSSLRKDKFWIFWLATIKWAWDLRCRSRCPWSRSKFSYNPVVQQKMFLLNILRIKKNRIQIFGELNDDFGQHWLIRNDFEIV